MSRNVLIVGAGPGGLASAMLAAAAGLRVTLVERRDRVGGRTSTVEADGFRFDLGPTFFLYPQVLERIFAACGFRLQDHVELIRLDPQYHLIFQQGGEVRATGDVQRMQQQLATLSPQDALNLPRYLAINRAKLAAFKPILESPFLSWRDCLRWPVLKSLPHVNPHRSVDTDLRRLFRDERVRLAFSFQSKYLGMSPFQCPSLFTILSFLEYEYGVYHPVGGCAAISEAMADLCRRLGVDVRLNEPVERLLLEGTRCVGVATRSGELRADAVVLNADFAAAMTQLVPDEQRRRWSNAALAKKKFSCSTFMMYLGVDATFDHLEHHTIYLAQNYGENLKDIETRHRLSENPSFYVQNACRTDGSMARRGSALYVLAPVTHEHPNVDWDRQTPLFRRRMYDQLAKLGLDGIEKHVRYEKILTPAGWRSDLNVYRGATFNLAHSLGQMLHLRPRNRFEGFQGLYLTGGGTHPGSGLPVIFESARITHRLLAQDLGVEPAVEPLPPARLAEAQPQLV